MMDSLQNLTPASTVPNKHKGLSAIICADWGKESRKRAVFLADVAGRTVRRIAGEDWSVTTVLAAANHWISRGTVLVTFDAPIGVPASFLSAVAVCQPPHRPESFLELLEWTREVPLFFESTRLAEDWRIDRPFFTVPGGEGGLTSYRIAAERLGVDHYRMIDRLTKAKTVFAKSGIPGSVGSGASALWQELRTLLRPGRSFRVWPFEGALDELIGSVAVVVGEIYPRAAYATALLDVAASARPPLAVAKTDAMVRSAAIEELLQARWIQRNRVRIEDADAAAGNEDDFDACITAAALLRCVLEGLPLCPSRLDAHMAEGGILGTGTINLELPEQTFRPVARPRSGRIEPMRSPAPRQTEPASDGAPAYRCPIAGCPKRFEGSRGGWDAHVGSPRTHANWHPELASARDRKEQFRRDFPDFFL